MTSLFQFMPYGAPELIENARQRMARASALGMLFWAMAFALLAIVAAMTSHPSVAPRPLVIHLSKLVSPPPLERVAPPARPAAAAPKSAVTAAVPVPVAQAPPTATIKSQEELSGSTPSVVPGNPGAPPVVEQPPAAEETPKLGEYVYFEVLPELLSSQEPVYPEIAKVAGVEGRVLVYVLVGKDGHVLDARVDPSSSILMLDEAALTAARTSVFKPALANGRPVTVWVTRSYNFRLH